MKFAFEDSEGYTSLDTDALLNQVLEMYGCLYLTKTQPASSLVERIPRFITDCGCCLSLKGLDYYLEVYKKEIMLAFDVQISPVPCFMCFQKTYLRYSPIPTSHLGESVAYIQDKRRISQVQALEHELNHIEANLVSLIAESRQRLQILNDQAASQYLHNIQQPSYMTVRSSAESSISNASRKSSTLSNRSGLYQFTDMLEDEEKDGREMSALGASISSLKVDFPVFDSKKSSSNPKLDNKCCYDMSEIEDDGKTTKFLKKRIAFEFDDSESIPYQPTKGLKLNTGENSEMKPIEADEKNDQSLQTAFNFSSQTQPALPIDHQNNESEPTDQTIPQQDHPLVDDSKLQALPPNPPKTEESFDINNSLLQSLSFERVLSNGDNGSHDDTPIDHHATCQPSTATRHAADTYGHHTPADDGDHDGVTQRDAPDDDVTVDKQTADDGSH